MLIDGETELRLGIMALVDDTWGRQLWGYCRSSRGSWVEDWLRAIIRIEASPDNCWRAYPSREYGVSRQDNKAPDRVLIKFIQLLYPLDWLKQKSPSQVESHHCGSVL